MKIEYLCDNEQYVDIDGIRPGIPYDKVKKSFRDRKKESMPITVVALENKVCIGVASLIVNDLKAKEYAPWLALVLLWTRLLALESIHKPLIYQSFYCPSNNIEK